FLLPFLFFLHLVYHLLHFPLYLSQLSLHYYKTLLTYTTYNTTYTILLTQTTPPNHSLTTKPTFLL
ncbi:hypothetical protein, partial [Bacillus thuringiensis]|uniref:hypothetical protein n=1 Tax=Bacillus thuringiensis TaxID=1428 RepID=UPI001C92F471